MDIGTVRHDQGREGFECNSRSQDSELCMHGSHHTEQCNPGCTRKAGFVPDKEAAVSPGKVPTMSLECCFVF